MKLKPLREQVVVVFGASSGIGRATALQLARRGAAVVVASRDKAALESLVEEIQAHGGQATTVVADAAKFEEVQQVAAKAVAKYGRLDTWVQTVGTGIWARFEDTTPEEFKRVVDVNLTGQAYGAMAALPYLKKTGRGAIIQVSSVEAEVGVPYQTAYAASKHGMKGYLEVLRLELAHDKVPISVTNIMPSGINTPFFNNARTKLGVKPTALRPIYQPKLVADAIVYAAEHPVPEITVGGGGLLFALTKRYAPILTDTFLSLAGFSGQKTSEPKSARAKTNLFKPVKGEDRIEGDFSDRAHDSSRYTWLATHPAANMALKAALVGAVAFVAASALRKKA